MTEEAINPSQKLVETTNKLIEARDSDFFLYAGEITIQGYDVVCDQLERLGGHKRTNAGLFLNTLGGDPHAAYRIARALGHHYKHLTLYVFGSCKSAGTLMALGFDELVIGDRGELGPMDVQLANRAEILEYNSGLDMIQAMDWLQRHAKDSFKDFLKDMRIKERLNTKFASDTARELTQGLFSGLYAKMDPVRLGHVRRTMLITEAYGMRLNKRSEILRSDGALHSLVYNYPTHDFVIDRAEARDAIFVKDQVRAPDPYEQFIGNLLLAMHPGVVRELEFLHLRQAMEDDSEANSSEAPSPPIEVPKPAKRKAAPRKKRSNTGNGAADAPVQSKEDGNPPPVQQ